MMNAIKVFAYEAYHGGTISAAEAAEEGINTDGLELASLEACKAQLVDGDIGNSYGGPIEVAEGFFEFDYDRLAYEPLKMKDFQLRTYVVAYHGILGRSTMEVKAPSNQLARQLAQGELNPMCKVISVKLKKEVE